MARKAKNAPTKPKSKSVKEFKAWLSGILEFQPDDWCPTLDQWKTIQDGINNLPEESNDKQVVRYQDAAQQEERPQQYQQPRRVTAFDASFQDGSLMQEQEPLGLDAQVPSVITIPDGVPPEILGHIPGVTVAGAGHPSVETVSSRVLNTGKSIKTAHIDTSTKSYKSPFG